MGFIWNCCHFRMKNKKEEEDVVSGTFTWVIDNFSKLKTDKHYSDVFTIGGFKWYVLFYVAIPRRPICSFFFFFFLGSEKKPIFKNGILKLKS